ncbi:MAG: 5'/3'-nucleotidase SurE [Rhodospirillaceae bacterium]|nr:5'/3'-nucleotidase SurE [Rhodospirillaceae bacterium]
MTLSPFAPLTDLKGKRILLSNDDGIAAAGLRVLEQIARALSDDVWVVAPAAEQSGAGHSLTLHHPLRPVKVAERRYTINGTPTDCVLVAINHLMRDHPPDLVLSGINMGVNLGEDVHYSGTVAAAMEGALLGVRAIAFSQAFDDEENIQWATAEKFGPDIVRQACALGWAQNVLINVNFPDCPPEQAKGVRVARQGKNKIGDDLVHRHDPRGRPYIWIAARRLGDPSAEGTDLKAVADGYVSVTPLNVDLTHNATMQALGKAFTSS